MGLCCVPTAIKWLIKISVRWQSSSSWPQISRLFKSLFLVPDFPTRWYIKHKSARSYTNKGGSKKQDYLAHTRSHANTELATPIGPSKYGAKRVENVAFWYLRSVRFPLSLAHLFHQTAFFLLMNESYAGCQDAESFQHAVDQQPESFYYVASFYPYHKSGKKSLGIRRMLNTHYLSFCL